MTPKKDDQFDDLDELEDFDEDFGSEDSASEDIGDDWDGEDEAEPPKKSSKSNKPAKVKKKSGSLGLILIVLVVLGGGGFFAMQMMAGGDASSPMPPLETAETAPVVQSATEQPQPTGGVQEIPGSDLPPMPAPFESPEQNMLSAPEQNEGGVTAPAMVEDDSTPAADTTSIRMPKADELLLKADEKPAVSGLPEEGIMPKLSEGAPVAPSVPAVPKEAEPVIAESNPDPVAASAVSVESENVLARMDQLIERLDKLEQDVENLRHQPGSGISAPSDETLAELKGSIRALERKVTGLSGAPSAKTTNAQSETKSVRILGSSGTMAAKTEFVPSARRVPWVLKGAQPGRAMIAKEGEREVQTVAVGDYIPGLGKILSIQNDFGVWVVKGSEGNIQR